MRHSRAVRPASVRAAAVFLLAAGLAVPALAGAPSAYADDSTVTGVSTGDDGTLDVSFNTSLVEWVQISVRSSAAADAPVLTTTDDLTGGRGTWDWKTSHAVSLPAGTAYGDYPVDVDFRLYNGTVQHWSGADHLTLGDLDYRRRAGVTGLSFDRATLDYDHQSAVLSGTTTEFDPATGTTGPAPAGTSVEIDYTGVGGTHSYRTTAAVTDDGSFQAPLSLPQGIQEFGAAVVGTADTIARPASWSGRVPAVVPTRYRVSAAENHTRVYAGSTYTESGSLQRYVDGYWKPWAGVTVNTATGYNGAFTDLTGIIGHGVTTATGAFSYTVKPARTADTYTLLSTSPYVTPSSLGSEHVAVPTPGSFTTPAGSIDQYGTVTLSGQLKGACDYEPLSLEYSANGSTGWTNMQWFTASGGSYNGTCSYKISKPAYYNAYYRVRHPETDVMQPAATVAKHIYRYRTGISIAMSNTKPKLNAKLTASGNVYQLTTAGWKPYAGVHVVLVFRPRGDTEWYWVVKGYTNSYGHYALNTQAFGDGTWGTYIEPNSSHYYSESRDVYVDAR